MNKNWINYIGFWIGYLGKICILSIPAWFLYIWLMVGKFDLPQLTLLEMVGVIFLSRILFSPKITFKPIIMQQAQVPNEVFSKLFGDLSKEEIQNEPKQESRNGDA